MRLLGKLTLATLGGIVCVSAGFITGTITTITTYLSEDDYGAKLRETLQAQWEEISKGVKSKTETEKQIQQTKKDLDRIEKAIASTTDADEEKSLLKLKKKLNLKLVELLEINNIEVKQSNPSYDLEEAVASGFYNVNETVNCFKDKWNKVKETFTEKDKEKDKEEE